MERKVYRDGKVIMEHTDQDWDGKDRRRPSMAQIEAKQNEQIAETHGIIVEIRLLQERFLTMDRRMSDFMVEMKEYQVTSQNQAKKDYEYLDEKIDKKTREAETIAREAMGKINDHILITKTNDGMGKKGAEWIKWVIPVLMTAIMAAVTIINL